MEKNQKRQTETNSKRAIKRGPDKDLWTSRLVTKEILSFFEKGNLKLLLSCKSKDLEAARYCSFFRKYDTHFTDNYL